MRCWMLSRRRGQFYRYGRCIQPLGGRANGGDAETSHRQLACSARGNRANVVLATKVRGRMWDGPNGEGLSRAHIMRAVEGSLRRLQTDYIDLYQIALARRGYPD